MIRIPPLLPPVNVGNCVLPHQYGNVTWCIYYKKEGCTGKCDYAIERKNKEAEAREKESALSGKTE